MNFSSFSQKKQIWKRKINKIRRSKEKITSISTKLGNHVTFFPLGLKNEERKKRQKEKREYEMYIINMLYNIENLFEWILKEK